MINRFILNEVSYFGPGAREVLPKEITRLGLHKAFVATDKDLIKYGVADKVLSVLKSAGIPYEVFSEIKQNPTVFNVKSGVKAFAESEADFILAIGGGSSIDTAKAIGIITIIRNSAMLFRWKAWRIRKRNPFPLLPCLLLPELLLK